MNALQTLAHHAAACTITTQSAATHLAVHCLVLDYFACTFAGARTPKAAAARNAFVDPWSGRSRVFGTSETAGAPIAAFLNGHACHILEFDDVHGASIYHPGAPAISAVTALADRSEAASADVAAAIIAGYEVGIRLGEAAGVGHYRKHHTTGTVGCLGAAAAAARLLKLDAQGVASALGHAATSAAALWAFRTDQADSKPLHAAHAAMVGVMSADLARSGLLGSSHAIDGAGGFLASLSCDGDPDVLTAGLGEDIPRIDTVTLKAYPCCGHTHSGIEAALALHQKLKAKSLTPDDISKIVVRTYDSAIDVAGLSSPQTPAEAAFSYPYIIAWVLRHGSLVGAFEAQSLADPANKALANAVELRCDDQLHREYPRCQPAQIEITFSNGSRLAEIRREAAGSPAMPMSETQPLDKIRTLAGEDFEQVRSVAHRLLDGLEQPA